MRKIIIPIMNFLLLPVTVLIFIAPVIVFFLPLFNAAFVVWSIRGIIVLWLSVFLSSFFMLSSYCGFLCPITKIFTLYAEAKNDRSILSHRFPAIVGSITQFMWIISALYVIFRIIGYQFNFLPDGEIYGTAEVVMLFGMYGVAAILLRTKAGSDELGHYLCPLSTFIKIGILVNKVFKIPAFRIVLYPEACKGCKKCSAVCSYQNDVYSMVMSGEMNYKTCSNCGKCIDACHQGAIKRKWQ